MAESLLRRTPPAGAENGRLYAVEQSLQLLAERADYLEPKVRRMRALVIVTGVLSIVALAIVLIR